MKTSIPFTASLTPAEELSPLQLAAFKRHQKNRTTPGNPKWYRPQVIRPFAPQLSVRLVRIETGAEFHTEHSQSRKCPFDATRGCWDVAEYVRAYQLAAGLKVAA